MPYSDPAVILVSIILTFIMQTYQKMKTIRRRCKISEVRSMYNERRTRNQSQARTAFSTGRPGPWGVALTRLIAVTRLDSSHMTQITPQFLELSGSVIPFPMLSPSFNATWSSCCRHSCVHAARASIAAAARRGSRGQAKRFSSSASASSSSAAEGSSSSPYPYPPHRNPTPHQIFHLPRNATEADIKARCTCYLTTHTTYS
jgi:hypothetical protein